jgi:hypothetical protein
MRRGYAHSKQDGQIHHMKPSGLKIETGPGFISVQRRQLFSGMAFLIGSLLIIPILQPFISTASDLWTTWKEGNTLYVAINAALLAIFVAIPIIGWQVTASAEFLRCDHEQLHIGRRAFNRRWTRRSFPIKEVHQLRYAAREDRQDSRIKSLVFEAHGHRETLFLFLQPNDAQQILDECSRLGVEVAA